MSQNRLRFKSKKRGNSFGFWFFKMLLGTTGLKGAYGFLYIVCFYYLLFDSQAVNSSRAYVEKRFPQTKGLKKYFHIYKLFISQGKHLIDRYAAESGIKKFKMELKGYQQLNELVTKRKEGFILLTSHIGNWQIAISSLKKLDKKVYLLMRPEDNPAVKKSLRLDEEEGNISILSAEKSIEGAFKIINILKEGGIVCIMGDRHYGFDNIEVSFLNHTAKFPYGAFTIGASLSCPIVALLSAKTDALSYTIDVTNIFYPVYKEKKDKKEQIKNWVQDYVNVLERYITKYPYQCFLFHNVWS